MGTINHLYDPNQTVWVIRQCNDGTAEAVQEGIVKRVRAEALITGTDMEYDIQLSNQTGTFAFIETDVFVDLPTAITEYQLRLT